jgi:D-lactate dehydrogenase (cytochrome)
MPALRLNFLQRTFRPLVDHSSTERPLLFLIRPYGRHEQPSFRFRQYSSTSPRSSSQSRPTPRSPPPPRIGLWDIFVSGYFQLLLTGGVFVFVGYQTALVFASKGTPHNWYLMPSVLAKQQQELRQPTYGSHQDYLKCIKEIKQVWAEKGKADKVSTDVEDLETHGYSDWSYHDAKPPSVVVWAESTAEVQEIVILSQKWKVPITPFAGGTSLEGHFSNVSSISTYRWVRA